MAVTDDDRVPGRGAGDADVPLLRPARPTAGRPHWDVPRGGWDCHAHVFGPAEAYPWSPGRRYTPPRQPVGGYLQVLDVLGIGHGVLVQPSVYGQDNRCLLDALDQAPDRLVGVVDVDVPAAPVADLVELTRRGVRGLRWSGAPTPALTDTAARLRELGWHLDLRVEDAAMLARWAPVLAELEVPVIVESMGSPRGSDPVRAPGFAALLDLLAETDHVWVKLSHPYQIDAGGPPYDRAGGAARALAAVAPDRLVWGSDWPHPMPLDQTVPDDVELFDLLPLWAGGPDLAVAVLRDNPARFYGATDPSAHPDERNPS